MGHLMHRGGIQVDELRIPSPGPDRDVRQEDFQERNVTAQIPLDQVVGLHEGPMMEHCAAAAFEILEDPDPQILRRCLEVQVRRRAAGDIIVGRIVHGRPAEQRPVRGGIDMGIHSGGRSLSERGDGSRHEDKVQADGKARRVLEYQAITRRGRELLGKLVIPVTVRIGRGEFHETVAAHHHAGKAVGLPAEGMGILHRDPPGRENRAFGCIVIPRFREQVRIPRQGVGLPFHRIPVNARFRPRNRIVLRDKALVQNLVADSGRELEIARDHGILPGNRLFRHFGIMIIVPFPDDPVIHRMIRQAQVHR